MPADTTTLAHGTVPRLRRLVPDFSPLKSGFDPRAVHVESVVNKITLIYRVLAGKPEERNHLEDQAQVGE